jgi:hypothetical protein
MDRQLQRQTSRSAMAALHAKRAFRTATVDVAPGELERRVIAGGLSSVHVMISPDLALANAA